jgi:hypothetical protein
MALSKFRPPARRILERPVRYAAATFRYGPQDDPE